MYRKVLAGLAVMCVFSIPHLRAADVASDDIVIYASDIPSSALHGSWSATPDATSPNGLRLATSDTGVAYTNNPLASPTHYVDVTFNAPAARAYGIWIRLKALGNSKYNDAVWLQFSDALAGGSAIYPIGTTSGLLVNLATDAAAKSLNGWGWQNTAYWLSQPTTLTFATSGTHTLRIQVREDGVQFDQIVLSPGTYLNNPPGPLSDDATIVPKPAAPSSGITLTYNAFTNRAAYTEPALPPLGPAGYAFTDPTFGSRIVRVTDANTRPGVTNRSYDTPSAAHQTAWNTDSTYFYIRSTDGTYVPYAFEPSTMTVSRIQATSTGAGGLTIYSNAEPQFSFVSPNVLYGTVQDSSNDWPIIRQYNFATGSYTNLLNLGSVAPVAQHTYAGGVSSSAGAQEKVLAFYGGTGQDRHYLATVLSIGQSAAVTLNTLASTVTAGGVTTPTAITLNFKLHRAWMDKSGRYVILETTAPDRQSPRFAAAKYVWDTTTNNFTALAASALPNGHYSTGFGAMINQDCCTTTSWDAGQWQFRSLATPTVKNDVITPVQLPKETYLAEHNSWNNAQAGALVPFVTGLYRYGNNTTAWRAWDDEIVAVQTDAGAAGATVWRFAHHRSDIRNDVSPSSPAFWYLPRPNVSQDGRWAIFTSNWEKTLGADSKPQSGSSYRQDVFLVELDPAQ